MTGCTCAHLCFNPSPLKSNSFGSQFEGIVRYGGRSQQQAREQMSPSITVWKQRGGVKARVECFVSMPVCGLHDTVEVREVVFLGLTGVRMVVSHGMAARN